MSTDLNLSIASACFAIAILLVPLLKCTHKTIRHNLWAGAFFLLSCGIGYGLQGLKLNVEHWRIFIAFASWIAAIVLVKSRSKILYLSESFNLLETTW
ncbi:MAG: hypothetical protein WBG66_20165, partial [Geitlerinemataceae cyanobacterium]